MAGKPGRSGRKPIHLEIKNIVDTNELFYLSAKTLKAALNSKKVSENKRIEIALAIYCKHLPIKNQHEGTLGLSVNNIKEVIDCANGLQSGVSKEMPAGSGKLETKPGAIS